MVSAPDKSYGVKSMPVISAGGMGGGGNSGSSGSSRSYPKGGSTMKGPADTDAAPFNPQKVAATSIYVGGV